jgi:protoporphyrinogen oxidase
MGNVIVLGTDLASLSCARALPGCRVLEATAHPGGCTRSEEMGGIRFDEGLQILDGVGNEFDGLLETSGCQVNVFRPVVRGRWQGRWLTEPLHNHLRELPAELAIRALSDLVEAHVNPVADPVDLQTWYRNQYGSALTEGFYDDFVAKYWRVRAETLTSAAEDTIVPAELPRVIRGALSAVDAALPTPVWYPAHGGIARLFTPFSSSVVPFRSDRPIEIDASRHCIRLESGAQESYDSMASSVPLPELIRIIRDVPADLRDLAKQLCWTQLLCVNLIVDRPRLIDCHWFNIYDRAVEAVRVSLPGNLAPGVVPEGRTALQAEIYRRNDESLPVESLMEKAVADLSALFGFSLWEIRQSGHIQIPFVNPIPDLARNAAAQPILDWLEKRGIVGTGPGGCWRHMTTAEAVRHGRETASRFSSGRKRLAAA